MHTLHPEQQQELLALLKTRFDKHPHRHEGIHWEDVHAKLNQHPQLLAVLSAMEESGGEPDVIGKDADTGKFLFCDCSAESPKGRRSVCYDKDARLSRKEHAPKHSAQEMAAEMGIELLTEEEYRTLQTVGAFDTKTSSWIDTPPAIRKLGGAIFADRRYDHVFIYHNGADSYYAARGFRGIVRV